MWVYLYTDSVDFCVDLRIGEWFLIDTATLVYYWIADCICDFDCHDETLEGVLRNFWSCHTWNCWVYMAAADTTSKCYHPLFVKINFVFLIFSLMIFFG